MKIFSVSLKLEKTKCFIGNIIVENKIDKIMENSIMTVNCQ